MNSCPELRSVCLLSYLFLLFLCPSLASSRNKVSLEFYYESLCPFCSIFIVNELPKIFKDGLISIVDLELVPYGNAKIASNGTIICQHGPDECLLNTVEACAIHAWPRLEEYLPFISCVENLVHENKYNQWETCFKKLKRDPRPVKDCLGSGLGNKLELEYAAKTDKLKPPHEYVPWVVVDGQPLREDYENFEHYICKAYKGKAKPKACRKFNVSLARGMKANFISAVHDKEEETLRRSVLTSSKSEQDVIDI